MNDSLAGTRPAGFSHSQLPAAQVPSTQLRSHTVGGRAGFQVVEANIFSRIARVGQSYVNAAINAAEDPEKMLDQTVNEMQEDLIKMRQAAAQVMASQKQLEMKHKQAQTTSDDWCAAPSGCSPAPASFAALRGGERGFGVQHWGYTAG